MWNTEQLSRCVRRVLPEKKRQISEKTKKPLLAHLRKRYATKPISLPVVLIPSRSSSLWTTRRGRKWHLATVYRSLLHRIGCQGIVGPNPSALLDELSETLYVVLPTPFLLSGSKSYIFYTPNVTSQDICNRSSKIAYLRDTLCPLASITIVLRLQTRILTSKGPTWLVWIAS